MIRGLRDLLNRMLGRGAPPPPRGSARSSAAQRAVENDLRIEYRGAGATSSAKPASVSWLRDTPRVQRFSLEAWRRRMSLRQRILLVAAAISLVAEIAFVGSRMFVNRRLPADTFGVWATNSPAYADRMFELRARRVAFVTGDSAAPVNVYQIRRVRRAEVEDGQRYTVEYEVSGKVLAFQFIFTAEPQPRIHFANQPRMAWARISSARTYMPEFY